LKLRLLVTVPPPKTRYPAHDTAEILDSHDTIETR